jgi:hypothetical protein
MSQSGNIFSSQYPSGILFLGALIIGVGLGMLFNNMAAFSLLGLGVGFVLVGIMSLSNVNKFLHR